jgi:hypothetical protein
MLRRNKIMKQFAKDVTIREKYFPAIEEITEQKDADEYFEACVQHTMSFGKSRKEAEEIERQNFGYVAGYFSAATRERVERLFNCAHPYFGKVLENGVPSTEQAIETGRKLASGQ